MRVGEGTKAALSDANDVANAIYKIQAKTRQFDT